MTSSLRKTLDMVRVKTLKVLRMRRDYTDDLFKRDFK